jgi:hypothetical protein
MNTLIDQFGLEQTGRVRGVVNSDDVLAFSLNSKFLPD